MALLDFAVAFNLTIINSLFKKKEEHLVTFRSGSCKTQIAYFLIRAKWQTIGDYVKIVK